MEVYYVHVVSAIAGRIDVFFRVEVLSRLVRDDDMLKEETNLVLVIATSCTSHGIFQNFTFEDNHS